MMSRSDGGVVLAGKRVWVAGHKGMVGTALITRLKREACDIVTADRAEVDLRRQAETEAWLAANRPHVIIIAAGVVGGIEANRSRPVEFLYDNLAIVTNIVHAAWRIGTEKLLLIGSSAVYPPSASQPVSEDALLTGPLDLTHEWYATAKIAGLKLCQAFRAQYGCDFVVAQPTNLYGPGASFNLNSSHVIPALLHKAHEAKNRKQGAIPVWGTGRVKREFLYVRDLADAVIHLTKFYSGATPVNVGTGTDVTIRELAQTVCKIVGFDGDLVFDSSKPDGPSRKLLDVSRLNALGWRADTTLEDGLRETYKWFRAGAETVRR